MRDYATVSPVFWTGQTGRRLKQAGPDAMLVGMYLVTSPHSNAMGLFYLPALYISHETGLTLEGATKALGRACEAGFCAYDAEAEVVWVFEMARFQIGEALSLKDNRVKWVNEEYHKLPKCTFLKDFFDKYASAFHLKEVRGESQKGSPLEVPSEPHRSQEQDQEQEQEEETPSLRSGVGAVQPEVEPALLLPLPQPKVFITIPVNGDKEHVVTEADVAEYRSLYGNVNVEMHLRKMRGHWSALPKNQRKTPKGIRKSINTWLAKEQDRACSSSPSRASPTRDPTTPRNYRECQDLERRQEAARLKEAMGGHNVEIRDGSGGTGAIQSRPLPAKSLDA